MVETLERVGMPLDEFIRLFDEEGPLFTPPIMNRFIWPERLF